MVTREHENWREEKYPRINNPAKAKGREIHGAF